MRIVVDREVCTGAGNCVRLAPDWFDQDLEHGLVIVVDAEPPIELVELMRDVVDACPTGAIAIEAD